MSNFQIPNAPERVTSAQFEKTELIEAMKLYMDYFGAVVLPEECTEPFSDIHQQMWETLTSTVGDDIDGLVRYAIGLPRGHAKTQLMKFLCLYIILFTKRRFILIVANTATKAQNLVDDILGFLSTDSVIQLFGDWRANIECSNQEKTKFWFNGRKVILKGLGIGSSVRGSNIDNRRPDVIICDDIQELEEAQSPEIAEKQLKWFLGTLLKARNASACTVIYIGNMYPDLELYERGSGVYGCILRNLELNSEWTSWVTGAILVDGTAIWERVHSKRSLLSDLAQDRSMGQEDIWYAEVQNSPKGAQSRHFNASKIPEYPYTGEPFVVGRFLMIDPSLGKATSDSQIVGLYEVYDSLGPVALEFREFQYGAPQTVKEVLSWALIAKVPAVFAETGAYQGTLLQWFEFWAQELGIEGIQFIGISRNGQSKVSAILSSFKQVIQGNIILHPNCKSEYIAQAQFYEPLKRKNVDDILDNVEYAQRIFLNYQTEYLVDLEIPAFGKTWERSEVTGLEDFNGATYDFRGE